MKKLLYALMWSLSEAVLGNMKRREQIFVLKDNVSQPLLALRSEVWVAQWQNTQRPGCFGPVHLGAKLDHTLEQPLNSVAMGILDIATKLDEGIHFLVSCLPGPEKLRSIKSCSCTRSKLEKQSPS